MTFLVSVQLPTTTPEPESNINRQGLFPRTKQRIFRIHRDYVEEWCQRTNKTESQQPTVRIARYGKKRVVPVSIVNDTGTNESNHLTTKFHRCRSGSAGIRYGEVRGAGGASVVSVSEHSTGDMANMGHNRSSANRSSS